jgi:hypothetical protein
VRKSGHVKTAAGAGCAGRFQPLVFVLNLAWNSMSPIAFVSPGRIKAEVAMLCKFNEQIADCYGRAQNCHEQALATNHEQTRKDYLDLERKWLVLARSYEFCERLDELEQTSANTAA